MKLYTLFLTFVMLIAQQSQAAITINITSPANGSTVSTTQPPITGIVEDSGTPQSGFLVPITINDVLIKTVTTDSNGIFNFTSADYGSNELHAGANTIKAEATPAETIITVNFSQGLPAPTIQIPRENGISFKPGKISIWALADNINENVTFFFKNLVSGDVTEVKAFFVNLGHLYLPPFDVPAFAAEPIFPVGFYSVFAQATDPLSGTSSAPSAERLFIISDDAPTVTSVTHGSIVISGTSLPSSSITVSIIPSFGFTSNCNGLLGTTTANEQGIWKLTAPFDCARTQYILEVQAESNSSTLTTEVVLSVTDQSISLFGALSKSIVNKYCSRFVI